MPKSCKFKPYKKRKKTQSVKTQARQARFRHCKIFFKEQEMSIFTRLVLGSAALAGVGYAGYKAKKHLDSQMENPENYGLDYKDVAFEEMGKIIVNGLGAISEGLAKGYEKIFDEPLYDKEGVGGVMASLNSLNATLRNVDCKHLNGLQLAPALAKKAEFISAEASRIGIPIYDGEMERFDKLNDEAIKINDFVDVIYKLEAKCYKTHKIILDFVCIARNIIDSSEASKIENLGKIYNVASSKYDINECGEVENVKSSIKSIAQSCKKLASLNDELKSSLDSGADSSVKDTLKSALELATALDRTIRGDFANYGGFCDKRVEFTQESA